MLFVKSKLRIQQPLHQAKGFYFNLIGLLITRKKVKELSDFLRGGGVWGLKMVNYCCLNENEIVQS